MSRYCTLSALSHNPAASAAPTASSTNSGSATTAHVGVIPYQNISPSSTTNEMQKSTIPAMTDASGTTRRGKYTLVIRCELSTRLLLDCVSANANNCHGSSAQYANTGYGTPSEPTLS